MPTIGHLGHAVAAARAFVRDRPVTAAMITWAVAIVATALAWYRWVRPRLIYSHDEFMDLLLVVLIAGVSFGLLGLLAAGALALLRREPSPWIFTTAPVLGVVALFAWGHASPLVTKARDERQAINLFNQWVSDNEESFRAGVRDATVIWRGENFTLSGKTLMLVCGVRQGAGRTSGRITGNGKLCLGIDTTATPPVLGGYQRSLNPANTGPGELQPAYECFGIVERTCAGG